MPLPSKARRRSNAPRDLHRPGLLARVQSRKVGWSGPRFELPRHVLAGVSPHPAGARDLRFKDALVAPSPAVSGPAPADVAGVSDDLEALLAVNESEMSAGFVISSASLDRHGDNVLPSGCLPTLDAYHRNPVVFFAHKSEGFPVGLAKPRGSPPGRKADLRVRESDIISRVYFHDRTEEARDVFRLVAEGVLRAASIGFLPIRGRLRDGSFDVDAADDGSPFDFDFGGIVFEEWQLLEWSVVPVPANADALRSWLDPSKKLSRNLRKSLAPYAAPRRASLFLSRPNAPHMKRKNTAAPAPTSPNGPEQPTDEGRIDKADVQCIEFDVGNYPDEASCRTWLEANGFDDVEMTPDHGGSEPKAGGAEDDPSDDPTKGKSTKPRHKGGSPLPKKPVEDDDPPVDADGKPVDDGDPKNFFFCVFSDTECEADSHRIDEVEQGVKFHCCKRTKPKPDATTPGGGDEKEPVGGDSYDKGGDDDPTMALDADPEVASESGDGSDAGGGKPKETLRPYGAEVLTCIANHLGDVVDYLGEAVQVLEHPKVLKYCEKLHATLSKLSEDVAGFGFSMYPDHFDEPSGGGDTEAETPAEESPEDDEGDEPDDKKKPFGKSTRYWAGVKSLNKKQAAVVDEAAEFFEELATEDNLKKSQRAASRLHAQALRSISGPATGDEDKPAPKASPATPSANDPSDEEVRAVLAQLEKINDALGAVNERYYEQTGTSLLDD